MSDRHRKDGTLYPSCDPSISHPGMVFYASRWRTPGDIERRLEKARQWKQEHRDRARDYQRNWYEENRDSVREAVRKRYKRNPEKARDSLRAWKGRTHLIGQSPMTRADAGRYSSFMQSLRKAVADKHVMSIIENQDARRAALMRLAVDEGATPFERHRAQQELNKHNAKAPHREKEKSWQHSQTTSSGTPTPQLTLKSASS